MSHKLPALPYAYDALEPHIDAQTMEIHHTKHHQAYVNNLNAALEGSPELQKATALELITSLNEIPSEIRTAVRNNGGGHVNHSMFWTLMKPGGGGQPSGRLADAIMKEFGSFDDFKSLFTKAAMTRFGSGWAWLSVDSEGKLVVSSTANQDNPVSEGLLPILGLDVWEHAYYLKYMNRRNEYVDAWFNVLDWDRASSNFTMIEIGQGIGYVANWVSGAWSKIQDGLKG